jgi:tRNA threonylcarbamoyl adenosine modification protein (Sua5/YciO/YrdC/YwlC family)
MEIVTKEEFENRVEEFIKRILDGAIFIYPTDTIYGIGCDATNAKAVAKIRELKGRIQGPFSVIAPSKGWIEANCGGHEELANLPGQYTIIMRLRNKDCVADEVNPGRETLGVRIPNHWFSAVVEEIGVPIITTSVNKKDEPFMTSIEDLDADIKGHVDFMINEGPISGRPSTLIDLTQKEKKVTKR